MLEVTRHVAPSAAVAEIQIHQAVQLVDVSVHHLVADIAKRPVEVLFVIKEDQTTAGQAAHDLGGNPGVVAQVDDVHDDIAVDKQKR